MLPAPPDDGSTDDEEPAAGAAVPDEEGPDTLEIPGVSAGRLHLVVPPADAGSRIDRVLGRLLAPHFSRSFLAALVEEGRLTLDGRRVRQAWRVEAGQVIAGDLGQAAATLPQPEPMELTLLFEDEALIVVDKPVGLIIHPGSGRASGTLVNGLLARFPELARVGRADRPGIVHRLDRETSGVLVVARTNEAARSLVTQFKERTVHKEYTALLWGELPFDSDWIEVPLGAHPRRPTARAVLAEGGQPSSTFYRVQERLRPFTLVTAEPHTGRTHQLRVHFEHLGYPIVGDHVYGHGAQAAFETWKRRRAAAGLPLPALARHALHAQRIRVRHPVSEALVEFESPLPADMAELLAMAREGAAAATAAASRERPAR